MEMWFSDAHTDVKTVIRVDHQLYSAQSEYQRIDVLESKEFGVCCSGRRSDADRKR